MRKSIGYAQARNLMRQLDWKLAVNTGAGNPYMMLYHPKRSTRYTVRWDGGEKLLKECRLIEGAGSDSQKVYCYDWDGSNEKNI